LTRTATSRRAGADRPGKRVRANSARKSDSTRLTAFGTAGPLALLISIGLLMIAFGNNAARDESGQAPFLFWGGLIVIYAPVTLRMFSRSSSRTECIALSVLLGIGLYVVKVLYNPGGFIPHDEMATLRQTWELLQSGHYLSPNPIVQGYAGYPGLEAITAALTRITGLSVFVGGTVVIGAARLTLMLALFLFLERVSGSHRVAAIGIVVYVCNPSFLYFDAQFGYESLALPIGAALILLSLRWTLGSSGEKKANRAGLLAALVVVAATLVLTHHLTSYGLLAFLLTWALVIAFDRSAIGRSVFPPAKDWKLEPRGLGGPALPAAILAALVALWLGLVAANVTSSELGSVFKESFESIVNLATGQSGSKQLFESGNGQSNTAIARLLGVASIIPLLLVIPFGLWRIWRRPGSTALWRALALVGALYPITLGLRLTQAGTETSQRASEFVFVGLAFLTGLLLAELQRPKDRWRRAAQPAGFVALATIVFLGGFIVGESPLTRQPGPYVVSGESRSVSPEALAASRFAANHLPPHSRILTDRVNATLLAAYGHLDPVVGQVNGIPVSRVFFSRTYDDEDQTVISEDAIDYIVVDRRFVETPPASGYYYEKDEPSNGRPLSREAVQKFADLEGLERVYDDGAIAIYDTAALRSAP
jgi:hypothetical protein